LQAGDVIVGANSGRFDDLPGFRLSFASQPAQLVLRIVRGNVQGNLLMQ
jgi:serine protease Do